MSCSISYAVYVLINDYQQILQQCSCFTSTDTEDYVAFQLVSLTFDVGLVSGDEQCYDVVIIDDSFVEDNETFFVTLTSPEPALLGSIISRATVTINPDPADSKLRHMCSLKCSFLSQASCSKYIFCT
jgi:hypothetical protein